ncbi:MAG TPA: mechanosensitive ion channel family protein [Terriglobales bacterium]|nr:mechanosensitive ion channel family protein [Terriglobales bacterium]
MQSWRLDALEFLRKDSPKLLLIIVLALVLIRLMKAITNRLARFSQQEALPTGVRTQQLRTLAGVIYSVSVFAIVFLALMQVLEVFDINMGPLLASAGIVGLAIGFGAQTLVKDVINGFFILMENQYDVGDVVRIAGVGGTVEAMTLRRTTLRDVDGAMHIIPNSEIKIVSNLTRDWAQVSLRIAVDYKEDSERIVRLLTEVGAELRNDPQFGDDLVAQPEVPGIDRIAPGEVDYVMLVKTKPGKQYAVTRELRRLIKTCFEKHNVQPAGPGRVYVIDQVSTRK